MPAEMRRAHPGKGILFSCFVLAALLLSPPPATLAADLFYNATLGLKIGDDARFLLNLTNEHFSTQTTVAVSVIKRSPRPADDFPIAMLLAAASGRKADSILDLRLKRAGWSDVFFHLGVSPQILFAGMERNPGPPYGRAWGHWKNHKGEKRPFSLPDAQMADLARLQVVSAYYRVSPHAICGELQRGMTVERYAVIHGRPSGTVKAKKNGKAPAARANRPERGQGQDRGPAQGPPNR